MLGWLIVRYSVYLLEEQSQMVFRTAKGEKERIDTSPQFYDTLGSRIYEGFNAMSNGTSDGKKPIECNREDSRKGIKLKSGTASTIRVPCIHEEAKAKLLDITDASGNTIRDGARLYDPKRYAVIGSKKTLFRFKVENQSALVTISIMPHEKNISAKKYYRKPGYVIELQCSVEPGEHSIPWDGRGTIDGNRYILQGDYLVLISAKCSICGHIEKDQNQVMLKVKKPYAFAFEPAGWSYADAIARSKLAQLSDGTGFEVGGTKDEARNVSHLAKYALEKMPQSAIWFFSGHGYRDGIRFERESTRPETWTYLQGRDTQAPDQPLASNIVEVEQLPGNALEDVFLVILLCCNVGHYSERSEAHRARWGRMAKALISKGADIVLAFDNTVQINQYQQWTSSFLSALNEGLSIIRAAAYAASKVDSDYQEQFNAYRVFYGTGASPNEKLLPARYGRRSGTRWAG